MSFVHEPAGRDASALTFVEFVEHVFGIEPVLWWGIGGKIEFECVDENELLAGVFDTEAAVAWQAQSRLVEAM